MATNYGENADKRLVDVPSNKIDSSDAGGRVRMIYDKFTLTAALAQNDTIVVGSMIPAGARVLDAKLVYDQLDAAGGTADLGWQASSDGGEAADPNGLIDGADVTSAGVTKAAAEAGIGKKFTESVQPEILAEAAGGWDQTSGDIECFIWYSLD
jgi:hypothetical protein